MDVSIAVEAIVHDCFTSVVMVRYKKGGLRMKELAKHIIPSFKECCYILFSKKVCPNCGGILKLHQKQITANIRGEWVHSADGDLFHDRSVTYDKEYHCSKCGGKFGISQLINKSY